MLATGKFSLKKCIEKTAGGSRFINLVLGAGFLVLSVF